MYKEETQDYIKNVTDYLKEQWGEIRGEWKPLIKMLAEQYNLFLLSREIIETEGLIAQGARGRQAHPAIKIQTDALVQCRQLIEQLGISPKALIRLKLDSKGEEDDFIDNLTK